MFQRLFLLSLLLVLVPARRVAAASEGPEEAYQRARTAFYALKEDEARRKLRHNWRNVSDRFLQIASLYPKSDRAPDALFTAAGLLNDLSQISRLDVDLRETVATYEQLLVKHPTHRLADDGALALAQIQLERIGSPSSARKTIESALKLNPRGDCAGQLRKLLATLPATAGSKDAIAKSTEPRKSDTGAGIGDTKSPVEVKAASAKGASAPLVDSKAAATKVSSAQAAETKAVSPKVTSPQAAESTTTGAKVVAESKTAVAKLPSNPVADSRTPVAKEAAQPKSFAAQLPPPQVADVKAVAAPKIATAPETLEVDDEDDSPKAGAALVQAIQSAARSHAAEEPPRTRTTGRALGTRPRVITVDDDVVSIESEESEDELHAAASARPATELANALVDTVSRIARKQGQDPEGPSAEEVAALQKRLQGAGKAKGAAELTLAEQLGLKIRRVVIDAGHGGHDTGAIGKGGTREKDVALAISKRLAAILRDAGLEVVMTRDTDKYVKLEDRTRLANQARGDLFISVHCNAAENRKLSGVETYTLNLSSDRYARRLAARENSTSEKSISDLQFILADLATKANTEESTQLAERIQGSLVSSLRSKYPDVKDLGNKEALFFVLLGAKMPAILVETSFLSNPDEEKRLASSAYQERIANAIAEGVQEFLGKRHRMAKVH